MQKKIIALAVAGLVSGAAFAQSNVTIYGVADATFDVVKLSGNNSAEPRHNRVSANSSFLGFKGEENLGNGLKAVFQFEGGVNNDNGGAWGGMNRDSFVGLGGGFGTVAAGNLTGPTRALGSSLDVFAGATGIGANSGMIGKFGGLLEGVTTDGNGAVTAAGAARSSTRASVFDTRFKNTVAYISPSFSGLTFVAAYVANENNSQTVDTSGYDIGANYSNGPLTAGLTYNKVNVRNDAVIGALAAPANTLTSIKAGDLRLGGSYNFGVAKLNAMFDRVKVSATGFSETQKVWGLGLQVPVGAGKIVGQYYRAGDISGMNDTGAKLFALGYEHSLSKRTILKATYAKLTSDDNSRYGLGVNSTLQAAGESISGFQFGVRHSF